MKILDTLNCILFESDELRLKDALSQAVTRGVNLRRANLCWKDLERADLSYGHFEHAFFLGSNLTETNLKGACLAKADMRKTCLKGATLKNANLAGAIFTGADLTDVKIEGILGYAGSRQILQEIIRRQSEESLTIQEWGVIGQIVIKRFSWEDVAKRFGKKTIPLLKKLSKLGFNEFLVAYERLC